MTTDHTRVGRVDLHLHSWASNRTNYYAANAFRIPESYSDPEDLYALLKSRGMDLVTLTDHNSIDGGKRLLDLGYEDVFLSSELTCRFPDGCHVHVTVANLSEDEFRECDRLRGDIYELVDWLEERVATEASRENRLTWFMTHPLMSTENRPHGREGSLTLAHLEEMLLLVPGFEVRNGARTRALNELTQSWLESVDLARLQRIADRCVRPLRGTTPWRKFYTGGSDDHAGIHPGHTWTEFPYIGGAPTANDLVAAMRARTVRPSGAHGGPLVLAHALLKLMHDGTRLGDIDGRSARRVRRSGGRRAADAASPARARLSSPAPRRTPVAHAVATAARRLRSRTRGDGSVAVRGPIAALLELVFDGESQGWPQRAWFAARSLHARLRRRRRRAGIPFEDILETEIYALLSESAFRRRLARPGATVDDRMFLVLSTLVQRVFARYVDNLRAQRSGDLVGVVKEVIALLASHLLASAPYLASFLAQSADSRVAHDLRRAYGLQQSQRLVLITDTYFDVNGVAATIQRMQREATRRDVDLTVVTCIDAADRPRLLADPVTRRLVDSGRLVLFDAIASIAFPEYEGLRICFPPMLELLRYMQESGFTKVHVSTPGVVGLVGLAMAKVLQLETAATYHTSVPEYVENYTKDLSLEELAWKYMIVFYHSVGEVVVPSRYVAKQLHRRGLRNRKLLILDRWVDCERFTPAARVEGYWARHGVARDAEVVKFVYVGRLGVEKNLALVADAYRALRARRDDVHLVLIGDGPYRSELIARLEGLPVTWTGFLGGAELPRALASCDVKLFPSLTDTWGNAPLEAQACGLPVIVSEVGGPLELMRHGLTGLRISGRSADELVDAMIALLDPEVRARMGAAARRFCLDNRVEQPFTAVFDSDAYRRRVAEARLEAAAAGIEWGGVARDVIDLFGAVESDARVADVSAPVTLGATP